MALLEDRDILFHSLFVLVLSYWYKFDSINEAKVQWRLCSFAWSKFMPCQLLAEKHTINFMDYNDVPLAQSKQEWHKLTVVTFCSDPPTFCVDLILSVFNVSWLSSSSDLCSSMLPLSVCLPLFFSTANRSILGCHVPPFSLSAAAFWERVTCPWKTEVNMSVQLKTELEIMKSVSCLNQQLIINGC